MDYHTMKTIYYNKVKQNIITKIDDISEIEEMITLIRSAVDKYTTFKKSKNERKLLDDSGIDNSHKKEKMICTRN